VGSLKVLERRKGRGWIEIWVNTGLVMMGCLMGGTTSGSAQDDLALTALKKATAYLEVSGGWSSGTAFCISEEGYFMTCAHVLDGKSFGDKVKLSLEPGLPGERNLEATVIRVAAGLDLAILKVDEAGLSSLKIGDSSGLRETEDIVVAGFPLGDFLNSGKGAPAVTISTGKVTALRGEDGVIETVQVDAELNPGNSGGPVINAKGEVVGVAVSTIVGTRLNFAISTARMELLMHSPRVDVSEPERIGFKARHEKASIGVILDFLRKPEQPPALRAWFIGASSGEREVEVRESREGAYEVEGVPVAIDAAGVAKYLRCELIKEAGTARHTQTCEILDGTLKVNGQEIELSKVSLVLPARGVVLGHDGNEISGSIEGLNQLQRIWQGRVEVLDGSNYDAVALRPTRALQEEVTFRIEVKGPGYVTNVRGVLPLEEGESTVISFGDARRPPFVPSREGEETFPGERVEVAMEGEIQDVGWGGGGRYVAAYLRDLRRLEVVDCVMGAIVGTVPVVGEDAVFGIGARELLVAEGNRVTRWRLNPFGKVGEPVSWVPGRIHHLSVGHSATQVVGVHSDVLDGAGLFRFELRDIEDGRLLAIEPINAKLGKAVHIRASAEGYVHGMFENTRPSAEARLYYPSGAELKEERAMEAGWLTPGPDGQLFYTAGGWVGIRGYEQLRTTTWESHALFPTTVNGLAGRLPAIDPKGQGLDGAPMLDLVDPIGERVLLPDWIEFPEFDSKSMAVSRTFLREDPLTWDKRIFCSPQLGIVATVPLAGRSVVIRKVDVWEALREQGVEFIMVTASVPVHLEAGTELNAELSAETSSTNVLEYELVQGPEGMLVSKTGELTWDVPKSASGSLQAVLVRIHSAEGREDLWSHEFSVK